MDSILVKIFATAFALGEVLTHPQVVRTHLDPATDQDKVVQVFARWLRPHASGL
jgi:hypothetical protein